MEFQLQHQSFYEHPGLISFGMDWLDLLAVQETLNSLLQHHSSKASILLPSAFLIVQLSHPYVTTGKTIALTRWTFVGKVMSLHFSMPSRLVITFLPRSSVQFSSVAQLCPILCNPMNCSTPGLPVHHSKCLLISWLQSSPAVILEPPKIKSATVSTISPSIYHEVMEPDAMIFVF